MATVNPATASRNPESHRKSRRRDRAAAREAERQLLLRYHRWGDLAARDELVERLLPLARDLARRYANGQEPLDDLQQVASLGLVKAIDRFDPDHGSKFTSYAAPTILGELRRHFRDQGWALHVPRDLQERALALRRANEALSKKLGRSPKVREVAAALGCSVEQALEAAEAAASYETTSLDTPVVRQDQDSVALVDLLGDEDPAYELVEHRDAIAGAWRELPDLQRDVLELRFMHDMTQREIGLRLGYSQMHVSRLLRRALTQVEQATAAAS
jgi:RNA polymerase sigma-B factor